MKRIVVDFDDTLSFTFNRDWENAKPNVELINKLNKLQNEGWVVDIYTARGSLSCSSREEAAMKYKPQIEAWLKKHNVEYNSISFDKPLAIYYIDDKGITPEDFININIEQLQGGLSGSDIYSDGKIVHKKDNNIFHTIEWFKKADLIDVNVPKVYKTVGDTISMNYIKHDKDYFKNNIYKSLGLILDVINKMSITTLTNNSLTFKDYINRIETNHYDVCKTTFKTEILSVIDNLYIIEKNNIMQPSFAHGDFGITNMLFTNNELYLIDPIPYTFTNVIMDGAKFIASLIINEYEYKESYNTILNFLNNKYGIFENEFSQLILAEMIRVYKYYPNKNKFLRLYKNVCKSI